MEASATIKAVDNVTFRVELMEEFVSDYKLQNSIDPNSSTSFETFQKRFRSKAFEGKISYSDYEGFIWPQAEMFIQLL